MDSQHEVDTIHYVIDGKEKKAYLLRRSQQFSTKLQIFR